MALSVHNRLVEIGTLLDMGENAVSRLDSLNGARNPFCSLLANATLHDALRRVKVHADWLSHHYGVHLSRQNARKGGAK
jgi:hypothetical protein